MVNVIGLAFDIIGAWLLIWGEICGDAAFLKYRGTGEGKTWFDKEVKKLIWYKQWPLELGKLLGSKKVGAMGQVDIFDSFPLKAWGVIFLTIGFSLQAIGSFGCQK
jgi:hypothetical protein